MVLCSLALRLPWDDWHNRMAERRAQREALTPLLREARESPLSYPQVRSTFPAYAGRIVLWTVTVQPATTFVDGRQAWAVTWTNPARVEVDGVKTEKVLARVADVKAGVVRLDYLGRP